LAVALASEAAIRGLVTLSAHDASASHLVLVPFVSIALIYQGRHSIFESVRSEILGGVSLILIGLGLAVFARLPRPSEGQSDLLAPAIAAAVVLWIGGFLLCFGWKAFRRGLFPLLFLGFMIPIPESILDVVVYFLKTGSTETVAALFTLTGTPYYRDGFVFALPNLVIEIADECSGIRSSLALLLTSLLAGHLYLKTGWTKTTFAVAILPVAILKNGIRITTLSLFSMHVDPEFLTGRLHREGGIVFFLLALAILSPLFYLLRNAEAAPSTKRIAPA
jgi:exosortase